MTGGETEDGIEVLNKLFRDATQKHGGNLRAVLSEVRDGIEHLDDSRKQAVSKALDLVLAAPGQLH